jgi:hypothetical protein
VSLQEVHEAVNRFLEKPLRNRDTVATAAAILGANQTTASVEGKSVRQTWTRDELTPAVPAPNSCEYAGQRREEFDGRLTLAVGRARATHQPLSVVALAIESPTPLEPEQFRTVERLLEATCRGANAARDGMESPNAARRVLVLAGRDRQDAVGAARALVDQLQQMLEPLRGTGQLAACVVAAGVASVVEPAKNFHANRLLETAQRCLAAALAGGGVKSLEVI